MAINVDAVAVLRVGRFNSVAHGSVIRLPAVFNAGLHFCNRQLAAVNWDALVGIAPDQALAQPDF